MNDKEENMIITITDSDGKETEATVTAIDEEDNDTEITEGILYEDDIPMMLSEMQGTIDIERGTLRMYIDMNESSYEEDSQSTEYVFEDDSLMVDIPFLTAYYSSETDYFADLNYSLDNEPLQTNS